jgi:hypothetical protein
MKGLYLLLPRLCSRRRWFGPVFLDAPGNKLERSVQKRPLRLRVSSDDAIIQVSTSAGVVIITGIALGWIAPTYEFGYVVRNVKRSLVVSPSFTFRTGVQLVQMSAMQARGGSRQLLTRYPRPRPC